MDLVNKEISKELGLKVEFADKKLKLTLAYDGKGADAGVFVSVDAEYFVDKLAEAIPGKLDDVILAALKGAFL